MFRMTWCLAAPAFVLLMGGTAHAALTVDEVWQSWQAAGAEAGLQVRAATENRDGGVLTLNGVSIAPAGMAGLTVSDIVLREAGDGSVTIVPGADIRLALTGATTGSASVLHDGLTLVAREADGGIAYDFVATTLDLAYDTTFPASPALDGTVAGDAVSTGTVTLTDFSGSYFHIPGALRTFALDIAAGRLAYDTILDDPGLELQQRTTSETADVTVAINMLLPESMTMAAGDRDFATVMNDGLSLSFVTTQGPTSGTMTQESPMLPLVVDIAAGGGEASGVFNGDFVTLHSTGSGMEIGITSLTLPAPVQITSGPIEVNLTWPVIAVAAPGDYGMVFRLSQLALNEEAWVMFDPAGALPRDPADIVIDLSGTTRFDLGALIETDPAAVAPPIPMIETLNITELTLNAVGAALAATGAFTFDNATGVPMPLGEANVTLTGANGLIDGLIASGLITAEDAMGARMMIGAFMAPGAGPDELTSKIEARAGFEIFVNGERVQ